MIGRGRSREDKNLQEEDEGGARPGKDKKLQKDEGAARSDKDWKLKWI